MRYALLINETSDAYDGLSQADQDAIYAEYMAISAEDAVVGGNRLQPAANATTVRRPNGEVLLTDGPFADTKEILGGFFLVDVADLDAALEIAGRIPAARMGGSVEVRPLVEYDS